MKNESKKETLQFHKELDNKEHAEQARFCDYVQSISKEWWAVNGKGSEKIQRFIAEEVTNIKLNRQGHGKHGVPQLSVAQTSERLGFGNPTVDPNFKEPIVGLLTSGST